MDFVTGLLPLSGGYDAIWIVIDRFTKQRHLVPCSTTVDAEGLGKLFICEIVRLHGLLRTIISDLGPQFAPGFGITSAPACRSTITPVLPPTVRQVRGATTEQYLWAYVNYQKDNWVMCLPMAEFAANNQTTETAGPQPLLWYLWP